ncbi:hypothetical protein FCV92_23245, partial [Escherichia coli]|nr:hypothetical protein [Escherichia coli]
TGGTADRNRSHWSTSKTPSYTKSVSWHHHPEGLSVPLLLPDCNNRYYSKYCLFHLRSCF